LDNPRTRLDTWAWMQSHWPQIEAQTPPAGRIELLEGTAGLCDPMRRWEVSSFFSPSIRPLEGGLKAYSWALSEIDACIDRQSHLRTAGDWLRAHYSDKALKKRSKRNRPARGAS